MKNAVGGPACAGVGIGTGTSYNYRFGGVDFCPPMALEDALGPVNIGVIAIWNCSSTTATETSSWSDLKVLFQ